MNFEDLKKILSAIDKGAAVNKDNVINEIKKVLQKEDLSMYQEWENKNFNINHVFTQSDPDARFTLLIAAVANGCKSLVNALLDRNADVHAEDENKETALHHAAYSNSAEIIDALLDRGAEINEREGNYHGALHYAAANGYIEVVNTLLAKGANVHEKNNYGKTPLCYAAANGHAEIVNALLAKGANINEKDERQKTPLHHAAANGHAEIVNTLLAKGANINEKDERQKTPLYYAIINRHEDVVEDIKQHLKVKAVESGATTYCLSLMSGIAIVGALFATGVVRITGMSTAIATAIVEVAALTIGYSRYSILRIDAEIKEQENVMGELQRVDVQNVRYVSSINTPLPIEH